MSSSPDTESASSLDEASSYTSVVSTSNEPAVATTTCEMVATTVNGKDEKRKCCSAAQIKEQAAAQLEIELNKTQQDLKLKDEEIIKLSSIRKKMEEEVEELTAALFEEANNKVRNANIHKARAEKNLREAKMKIDVLLAEVDALKTLVASSTSLGSSNNQNSSFLSTTTSSLSMTLENGIRNGLNKANTILRSNPSTPKKSPSNYELISPNKTKLEKVNQETPEVTYENDYFSNLPASGEVDPAFHNEFIEWKRNPSMDKEQSVFINRLYKEEIYPVFNFKNVDLTEITLTSIENNSIIVESVSDKTTFPKKCALLDIPRTCKYRMKLGDDWYNISELARNRIIAVCDLFCYLRYIKDGLVKSGFHDVYWEVMRRRRNIALSRFGFPCM